MLKVGTLLLNLGEPDRKMKRSRLDLITNRWKKQAIMGNYCQALLPVCFKASFDEEQLLMRKNLIKTLKDHSNEYLELKSRDLCDPVRAVCNLYLHNYKVSATGTVQNKWLEKELRLLAKRSAFMMSEMDLKQRVSIRDSFAMVDFYDADLV